MTVLIPNSILNILLEGRVEYILGNIDLKISNTQPRLKKKTLLIKKSVYLVSEIHEAFADPNLNFEQLSR